MNLSVVEAAIDYVYTGTLTLDWDLAQWIYSVGYTMGSSQLRIWSSQLLEARCVTFLLQCAICFQHKTKTIISVK